jgi:hypothetical protein
MAFVSTPASNIEAQTSPGCRDSMLGVPASRQKQVREFRQRVEAGPFYRELVRRLGTPESCASENNEDRIKLSYAFHNNARLEARIDPGIEFSEQRMTLRNLTHKNAIALLQEGEKDSFGKEGCGIEWDRPKKQSGEQAGSQEVVYQGNTCNCKGHVIYENHLIIALVLTSSC